MYFAFTFWITLVCTNLTLRCDCIPLLLFKSIYYYTFWVCFCILSYLACRAHAPYCYLWLFCLFSILTHYFIYGMIFGKKLLNIKCVFWFSLQTLCIPSCYVNHQINYTYPVKHNTGLFKFGLRLYMDATCFSPFSGHHQACQYKNLTKEDVTR